jgi:hypothetical protein
VSPGAGAIDNAVAAVTAVAVLLEINAESPMAAPDVIVM